MLDLSHVQRKHIVLQRNTVTKNRTAKLLLLSVAVLTLAYARESKIPFATKGVIAVKDDQLLSGDSNRTYLDITEVSIRRNSNRTNVKVTVAEAFPNQEFLFGTGFRFDICIFEQTSSPDHESEPESKLSIRFDSKGWRYHLFKGDFEQTDAYELRFEASSNTFTINFPSQLMLGAELLTVEATTSDFPKWKPVTTHSPISIQMRQNLNSETH